MRVGGACWGVASLANKKREMRQQRAKHPRQGFCGKENGASEVETGWVGGLEEGSWGVGGSGYWKAGGRGGQATENGAGEVKAGWVGVWIGGGGLGGR